MEYTSQFELYKSLNGAFQVKQRLLKNHNTHLNNYDIWKYLIETKWRNSHNLTISDIVNDIITIDEYLIIKYMEEQNEKSKIYN